MVKGAFPYVFVVYLWFLVHGFVWWFVWMCMESYYEAWKVGYYHLTGNSGCGVTFFYSSRFLLILHWAVLSWLPFNSQVHHWVLYMTGSVLHNTWFHQDIASVYIQETSNKSPKKWGHQSSGAGMSRKVIVAERLLCDGWYKREVPF